MHVYHKTIHTNIVTDIVVLVINGKNAKYNIKGRDVQRKNVFSQCAFYTSFYVRDYSVYSDKRAEKNVKY